MHVLLITSRADFGGGPEHVYQLARALASRIQLSIAAPNEEPYWARFAEVVGAENLIPIPHRRITTNAVASIVRRTKGRVDIIHAHGRGAGILGRLTGLILRKPCIYTPHGGTPFRGLKSGIYAVVESILSLVTLKIIAVSETEGSRLRRQYFNRRRVCVIPNGVVIPEDLLAGEARCAKPQRILHFTRFDYQKNSELLVAIAEELKRLHILDRYEFIVIGRGSGRPHFEALVRKAGLQPYVRLTGGVANPAVYFPDAFALISTSRWEGLPLALLEGMSYGLPVVATDVAGNQDAVAHGRTGFLYDGGSPGQAVGYLKNLSEDQSLWMSMGVAARRRSMTEFSIEKMAESTLSLYYGTLSHLEAAVKTGAGTF